MAARLAQNVGLGWALVLTLLSFLVMGCGSTRDDFVSVAPHGQNPPPSTTASLNFSFVRAQSLAPTVVPESTVTMRFQVFGSVDDIQEATMNPVSLPFSETMSISGVPVNSDFVLVTALDSVGFPVFQASANLNLQAGQTLEVQLGQEQQVSLVEVTVNADVPIIEPQQTAQFQADALFDNGSIVSGLTELPGLEWSTDPESVATVDAAGLVTGVADGQAEVTATLREITSQPGLVVVASSMEVHESE